MFIKDIEFIDPLSKKDLKEDMTITGGASAYAATDIDADDSGIVATASAKATGKYSKAIVKTKVKFKKKGKKRGKNYGYGAGYSVAYGTDSYGSIVKDFSSDFLAF